MLILGGGPALSPFRLEKLVAQASARALHLKSLEAHFFYLVDIPDEPSAGEVQVLQNLLDATVADADRVVVSAEPLLVLPRWGTRSPWSTKATEIGQRCGLDGLARVERGIAWHCGEGARTPWVREQLSELIHDPMTESIAWDAASLSRTFHVATPGALEFVDIIGGGLAALEEANRQQGFALSPEECDYLVAQFEQLGRNPTDTELMMFAQVNSEHCRHKIFNARWCIDGVDQSQSLFEMIRSTHERHGEKTLVAYRDNAAVIKGYPASWFLPDPANDEYTQFAEPLHLVAKVETHNHPTAISPFPGAATGSGGEIRDEGATGRGGKPKAGITGFSVSDLRLPDWAMPWELQAQHPQRLATPLQIMLEGPIGGASFNNEFGRPNIGGYFRTLEVAADSDAGAPRRGYHKPIMLAGGVGNIRGAHVDKQPIEPDTLIVVLGGPAMLIGLGGGAASSVDSGASDEALDFASVQRGNAEMQRRCQEVIDRCIALGTQNPIVSVHDVGAGGLSNALPELVHDAGLGAVFNLEAIPSDEPGLSPMQLWCNEAQERYVLAVALPQIEDFKALCERERCLFAVVGCASSKEHLRVTGADGVVRDGDGRVGADPVDLPMATLFGNTPRMKREVKRRPAQYPPLELSGIELNDALDRVLRLPAVADKSFLITIGDRSVGGQVVRDQMVGPWQVPVADAGITVAGFDANTGEALAVGERTPLALVNAPASGRMAVAEAITNIACAGITELSDVHFSANWMTAAGEPGADADLFDTVQAVAMELCPALGISIPVGKDSMSMSTRWNEGEIECGVSSPLSLVVTAFAPVADVRRSVTPELNLTGETVLVRVDLARGAQRLGASALAQVYGQVGNTVADVAHPEDLCAFFAVTRKLLASGLLLAYHDRSDGGLIVTLAEMAFASRCSLDIDLGPVADPLAALFTEELGAVLQVPRDALSRVLEYFEAAGLSQWVQAIGGPGGPIDTVRISTGSQVLLEARRSQLHRTWSELSSRMRSLRDNPECAAEEYEHLSDLSDPGLNVSLAFDPAHNPATRAILSGARPRVAILREQGVNGQMEMAAAFERAGFAAIDVTMSDLAGDRHDLRDFNGFAACGGFSFGDVLGAGQGWAKSILFQQKLREMFAQFFQREDIFALGVCNGCQMMAALKDLIPGAQHWPYFAANRSGQFESRVVMVEVLQSESVLFADMAGSRFPVVVAHGEGRAVFPGLDSVHTLRDARQTSLGFVDNYGRRSDRYPFNPNGSDQGITGLCAANGRVTIMMPHPERNFRAVTNSWYPGDWGEHGPWLRLFQNARAFTG